MPGWHDRVSAEHTHPVRRAAVARFVRRIADLAREFFGHHFPDEPVSHFVCHSWLLDPQLVEYLPERSNIVRFSTASN
jgi:hypothetical protein